MEKKTPQKNKPLILSQADTRTDREQEYKQRLRIPQKPEIGVRDDQETCQAIASCRALEGGVGGGEGAWAFCTMRNKQVFSTAWAEGLTQLISGCMQQSSPWADSHGGSYNEEGHVKSQHPPHTWHWTHQYRNPTGQCRSLREATRAVWYSPGVRTDLLTLKFPSFCISKMFRHVDLDNPF